MKCQNTAQMAQQNYNFKMNLKWGFQGGKPYMLLIVPNMWMSVLQVFLFT